MRSVLGGMMKMMLLGWEQLPFFVFISCSKSLQNSFTQFTRFLHVLWLYDIDAAYKIFFIILELISDYQLSSLFQIIILLKKSTRRGAFFHVFFSKSILDKFHFAFISAVSGTGFQLEKTWADSIITLKL